MVRHTPCSDIVLTLSTYIPWKEPFTISASEGGSRTVEIAQQTEQTHLVIREARVSDLQSILNLYAQLFSNTDQAEENRGDVLPSHCKAFSEIDQNPDSYLLVAESSGGVLGTLALTMISNLSHRGRRWALIENVVVDEHARRSSIGTALMQYAIALAREQGCFRAVLSSSVHRETSHKFYKRLGLEAYGYSFERYLLRDR